MTKPCTIKDLTLRALELLEMAYISSHLDGFRPSALRTRPSKALAGQHRERITFCKSSEVTGTLVLANLVIQLAFERKIPILLCHRANLITTKCSPVILVLRLLLWRAGIGLEEAGNPASIEDKLARLSVADREVASTPLPPTAGRVG